MCRGSRSRNNSKVREQLTATANCREHHYRITGHAAADGRLPCAEQDRHGRNGEWGPRRGGIQVDPPDLHGLGHVLDALRAQRSQRRVDLAPYLLMYRAGDADPARRRETFEARGDVDPIAEDIIALNDYVT